MKKIAQWTTDLLGAGLILALAYVIAGGPRLW